MKKVGTIIGILALVLAIGCAAYYFCFTDKHVVTEDSKQFKEEYEAYNGKLNEGNGRNYLTMDLKEYNPFKYSSYDEIFELFENGTGVIYFGFPTCPWCRNLVPVLSDTAIENNIDEILYLNILDDRDIKEVTTSGKGKKKKEVVKTTKEGSKDYLKLLETLGDFAADYTLKNAAGKEVNGGKRVYMPTVVFVKNGKVIGYEQSLKAFSKRVSTEEGGSYLPMNNQEKDALGQIFKGYFDQMKEK